MCVGMFTRVCVGMFIVCVHTRMFTHTCVQVCLSCVCRYVCRVCVFVACAGMFVVCGRDVCRVCSRCCVCVPCV